MTIAKYLWVALGMATLAFCRQIAAQVELAAPEPNTADQAEATPSTEVTPETFTGTARDNGSVFAGDEFAGVAFDLPRRMHVSANLVGGYDDNVNLSPLASPSWYSNVNGHFSYAFGTHRLAMDLLAGAGISYYFDKPGGRSYDLNLHLRLAAAYKISPRLLLNLTSLVTYESQPDYSTALSATRRLGNYFRSADTLSLNYQLTPRLSIISSYDLAILKYEGSRGALDNRVEQSFGETLRFLWLPTTSVIGEYRFLVTNYQNAPRDSTGHLLVVGLDHTFDPHWGVLAHAGVQFRISDQNATNQSFAGDRISPYVDAILHYRFEPNVFLFWTNRLSIEESDLPQDQGPTFRTNLQLNYGITARISANLHLSYFHREGGGSGNLSSGENVFDIGPSVRYAITRYLAFDLGYRYTKSDQGSNLGTGANQGLGRSYSRNKYFAGVNISF